MIENIFTYAIISLKSDYMQIFNVGSNSEAQLAPLKPNISSGVRDVTGVRGSVRDFFSRIRPRHYCRANTARGRTAEALPNVCRCVGRPPSVSSGVPAEYVNKLWSCDQRGILGNAIPQIVNRRSEALKIVPRSTRSCVYHTWGS